MAKAFQLDLNRCTGCQACLLACAIENEVPMSAGWRTVYTFNEGRHPALPVYHLTLACNHCDDPACLRGCPTRAYSVDTVTGAVVLDSDRCMGCTYCTWMCPYDAPHFDRSAGVVSKCTFCNHRLHEGLEPACVAYCPTTALRVGERNGSAVPLEIPGFTDSHLGPAISLVPLRDSGSVPELAPWPYAGPTDAASGNSSRSTKSKVSCRSEWTLVLFTILAPILVAWFAAAWMGERLLQPWVFAGLGVSAIAVSTLHLGRKSRAYLAVTNWRHSWLSREILLFASFVGLATLYSLNARYGIVRGIDATGWGIAVLGIAGVLCIDMVYVAAATVDHHRWHSASALLTSLFYFAVFAKIGWGLFLLGGVKAVLYVARKRRRWLAGRDVRMSASAARLAIGVVAPLALWTTHIRGLGLVVLACCLVGEIIDRMEFYDELEIVTPVGQIARDEHTERRKTPGGLLRARNAG